MTVKKSETKIGNLKSQRKLRIMVSSAVYGYQEFLDRIYDLLVALGYEVCKERNVASGCARWR